MDAFCLTVQLSSYARARPRERERIEDSTQSNVLSKRNEADVLILQRRNCTKPSNPSDTALSSGGIAKISHRRAARLQDANGTCRIME